MMTNHLRVIYCTLILAFGILEPCGADTSVGSGLAVKDAQGEFGRGLSTDLLLKGLQKRSRPLLRRALARTVAYNQLKCDRESAIDSLLAISASLDTLTRYQIDPPPQRTSSSASDGQLRITRISSGHSKSNLANTDERLTLELYFQPVDSPDIAKITGFTVVTRVVHHENQQK